ncbi:uncharacterized protein DUF2490 [Dyadobacter jejuensis]|uniref:Uncharacterized protein DUF2490 n=1 Tax=Dyadobacter jejuensis TaxID=1082580 RepID=A0A316AMC0_9BACT|nr:DUF2490 domain-containing protein [Dyadobacter jejuensis]PWJ58682.1 uncharacterized protein DUF2490 [Dyadobacter jejuensis]
MNYRFAIVLTNLLLFSTSLLAQSTRRNSWFRLTVNHRIGQNFSLDNEFQHRRQNNFDDKNYLSKALLVSYRSWVHYKPKKDVQVSLSPFAIMHQNPVYEQPIDTLKDMGREIRFAGMAQVQRSLFDMLYVYGKGGMEYRSFKHKKAKLRMRQRIGLTYSWQICQLNVYEELMLHVAGVEPTQLLDQNRLGASISLKPNQPWALELGYIHTDKLSTSSNTLGTEKNLFLNVSYQLGKN